MKYLLFTLLALLFIGCKAETNQPSGGQVDKLSISGVVQNGPFRQYTQGIIQGLDVNFNQVVGESIAVETSDIQGSYASQVTFPNSEYAKVSFTGQYFNENTGAYTFGELTTSSYVFGVSDSNVNLITHIIQDRVKNLVIGGETIVNAIKQATVEFMAQSTGEVVTTGANTWLISDSSPLLFMSVLLQHGIEGPALQNLVNTIRADFADGTLSQSSIDVFKTNATSITEAPIYTNVFNGLGIVTQSFTARLNDLDPSRLETSKHRQGGGTVSYSSGGLGASTRFFIPFVLGQQTQLKYASIPCQASNIAIYDSNSTVSGVYDETSTPNLTVNLGSQLGTATYADSAIPVRDYGNGVIRNHQAVFGTPLDLASGQYWIGLDFAAGCVVETYEPLQAERLIYESGVDLFTFPVFTVGDKTPYLEFL